MQRSLLHDLTDANLLRPYLFQTGLWSWSGFAGTTIGASVEDSPEQWHSGWDAPTSQICGHMLGHWLSAAAHLRREDRVLAARSDDILDALERCQLAEGDGWIGPFPAAQIAGLTRGRPAWAPHYVWHKLLAGLLEQAVLAGQPVARRILDRASDWALRYTDDLDRTQLDDMLDTETGGMLEVWAGMLELTGEDRYRTLLERYRRGRLVDPVLAGEDVLTGRHANTQIAEILGCARAHDATGEPEWLEIVRAFWDLAITRRGTYVTGGSSSAEVWQPPHDQQGRTHDVQEHCTVFHLMPLSDWLYRRTGEARYAEHWERNHLNGILAQQHSETGAVAYFVPLDPDSTKRWGRELEDFWCCHGTLLQARTDQLGTAVHRSGERLRISQWWPLEVRTASEHLRLVPDPVGGLAPGWTHPRPGTLAIQELARGPLPHRRPRHYGHLLENLRTDRSVEVELRVPDWAREPQASGEGVRIRRSLVPGEVGLLELDPGAVAEIRFGAALRAVPLPGDEERFCLVDGPLVLAGLCTGERRLPGPREDPDLLVRPHREREHSWWGAGTYRTRGIDDGFALMPLNEITDQRYSVYFLGDPPPGS